MYINIDIDIDIYIYIYIYVYIYTFSHIYIYMHYMYVIVYIFIYTCTYIKYFAQMCLPVTCALTQIYISPSFPIIIVKFGLLLTHFLCVDSWGSP